MYIQYYSIVSINIDMLEPPSKNTLYIHPLNKIEKYSTYIWNNNVPLYIQYIWNDNFRNPLNNTLPHDSKALIWLPARTAWVEARSWVIEVPPVIIHFERWDCPWNQPSSYGGTPMTMETPILICHILSYDAMKNGYSWGFHHPIVLQVPSLMMFKAQKPAPNQPVWEPSLTLPADFLRQAHFLGLVYHLASITYC